MMKTRVLFTSLIIGVVAVVSLVVALGLFQNKGWSAAEKETLKSLWLGSLPDLPSDPSNKYADDARAAALGEKIFFDTRFSSNGEVACGTCHLPEKAFTDGLPLAKGVGTTDRKTMTIVGTAYSPWLFWDGRKDSQWAQALGPLENENEHGGNRTQYAHLITNIYKDEYEAIFGSLPDVSTLPALAGPIEDSEAKANWEAMSEEDREAVTRIYVNMGKAIAAYERTIMPGASRFDNYVEALLNDDEQAMEDALTADEIAGLKLFIGKGNCTTCHSGSLFTNNDFHNTGVPAAKDLPEDLGRAKGVKQVLNDEFNCLSPYSDAAPQDCAELRFLKTDGHELERQFKAPTLRNVALTAPYMHAGQFATLRDVLEHYSQAPEAPAGHSELEPRNFSEKELGQLEAFLKSLDSLE
jgi:cytochrome c peroxidase